MNPAIWVFFFSPLAVDSNLMMMDLAETFGGGGSLTFDETRNRLMSSIAKKGSESHLGTLDHP